MHLKKFMKSKIIDYKFNNERELEESSALTKVHSLLFEKMERLGEASRTAKLWIQYME